MATSRPCPSHPRKQSQAGLRPRLLQCQPSCVARRTLLFPMASSCTSPASRYPLQPGWAVSWKTRAGASGVNGHGYLLQEAFRDAPNLGELSPPGLCFPGRVLWVLVYLTLHSTRAGSCLISPRVGSCLISPSAWNSADIQKTRWE